MSTTIDQKVVELQLNSHQFEAATKSATTALDILKKGLNFVNEIRNLALFEAIASKFSLNHVSDSVDYLSKRWSSLGTVWTTTIQNMTNSAIAFAKRLVNDMTGPITKGFNEYEVQMNAIQTILANTSSKGTGLDDVSASLDELNRYADKTIYNFTQMTKNVGTFTAAGIDLNVSVAAIKGIANLAAVSGSNAEQASTAMYQLSQALASGSVKLMDWNSVVNAGMGGEVFKDALIETARVHGVAIDSMIETEGSFKETLHSGWLTSEVLLETLSKFTGDLTKEQLAAEGYTEAQIAEIMKLGKMANDAATKIKTFSQLKDTMMEAIQSGWTTSWELIIGDFNEAQVLFTEIGNRLGTLIGDSAEARNKILTYWAAFGGREAIIDAIRNSFDALLAIVAPLKEAFHDVFGTLRGYQLADISKQIRDVTESFKIDEGTAAKFKTVFTGIFNIIRIGKDILLGILDPILELTSGISFDGSGLLNFLVNLASGITAFAEGGTIRTTVSTFIKEMAKQVVLFIGQVSVLLLKAKDIIIKIKLWFVDIFKNLDLTPLKDFFASFAFDIQPIKDALFGVEDAIDSGGRGMSAASSRNISTLTRVAETIKTFVKNISEAFKTLSEKLDFTKIKDFLATGGKLSIFLDKLVTGLKDFVTYAGTAIGTFVEEINFESLKQFLASGTLVTFILLLVNIIRNINKMVSGFSATSAEMFGSIKEAIDSLRGSFEAYQNNLNAKTLLYIAGAIVVLSVALLILSSIDPTKLLNASLAISALFVNITLAMASFNKIGFNATASVALVAFAGAILILSFALTKLSLISAEDVDKSMGAIYALSLGLVVYSKAMASINTTDLIQSSLGLVVFGVSMVVMAEAVRKLGAIDPKIIDQGLNSLAVVLTEVLVFLKIVGKSAMSITGAVGITIIAAAIYVLIGAITLLGLIDIVVLENGLIALGSILLSLSAFIRISGDPRAMISTSIGVVIISAALYLISGALVSLGSIDWLILKTGLIAMGAALVEFGIALRLMPADSFLKAAAIVAIAFALAILQKVLVKLGTLSWEDLGYQLLGLAGVLGVLSLALYLMSGSILGAVALTIAAVGITAIANAMTLLGSLNIQQVGIGVLALAAVFGVLGLATLILSPLIPVIVLLGVSVGLLGLGLGSVALGIGAFALGLGSLIAVISALVMSGALPAILEMIPVVIAAIQSAIVQWLTGTIEIAPLIFEAVNTLFTGFLDIIKLQTPEIKNTFWLILLMLVALLIEIGPPFIAAIVILFGALMVAIAAETPTVVKAGWDILIAFLQGFRDNITEVVTLVGEIVVKFIEALEETNPKIVEAGFDYLITFLDSLTATITEKLPDLIEAFKKMTKAIIDGILGAIATGASDVITAITEMFVNSLASAAEALGINSPSREFMALTAGIVEGSVKGIVVNQHKAIKAIVSLSTNMIKAFAGTSSSIASEIEDNLNIVPVIKPVVDLNDLRSGAKTINSLFGSKSLRLATTGVVVGNTDTQNSASTKPVEGKSTTQVQLTQNNYSPKALSHKDLYRNTQHLLRLAKGMV